MKANYEGVGDGEMDWTVRAKEEDLDKVVGVLGDAVEKAKAATHGACLHLTLEYS